MNAPLISPPAPRRHLICLDLVRSELGRPAQARRRLGACRRVLTHARDSGWMVTHVHPRSAAKADGSIEGLEPLPSERLVYRTGVSAFSNRSFCEAVRIGEGAELILVSLSLSSAFLVTAVTAHDWGLRVGAPSDAVLADGGEPWSADSLASAAIAAFVRFSSAAELTDARQALRLVVDRSGAAPVVAASRRTPWLRVVAAASEG